MLNPSKSPIANLSILLAVLSVLLGFAMFYLTFLSNQNYVILFKVVILLSWILGGVHIIIYPKKYLGIIGILLSVCALAITVFLTQ